MGQHVGSLVRHLVEAGAPPVVFAPASTESVFGFAGMGAVVVPTEIPASPDPLHDLAAVREVRASAGDLEVLHAHGLRAGLVTALAVGRHRPGRTPVAVTWHNAVLPDARHRSLLALLERVVARRADVTLGASADLVERALRLGARDSRLAPVAAPTLPPAKRDRAEVRAELGAGDRPLAVVVSRIAAQKGLDVLLGAAGRWSDDGPLVVVAGDGDPSLAQSLAERARRDRLPVRFLGRRTDVAELLGAADVVVLPSLWEARALVAQEALAAGVPLVATAVGGVPELVGGAAVLVPPGDPGALAAAVLRLLRDPGEAARLARAGLARAATWPDEQDSVRQVAAVYRDLAGGLGWQPVD